MQMKYKYKKMGKCKDKYSKKMYAEEANDYYDLKKGYSKKKKMMM